MPKAHGAQQEVGLWPGMVPVASEEASVGSSYNLRSLPAGAYVVAGLLGLLVALAFAGSQELLSADRWLRLLLVLPAGAVAGALAVIVYLAVLGAGTQGLAGYRRSRRRRLLELALGETETDLAATVDDAMSRPLQARLGVLHLLLGNATAGVRHLKRAEEEGDEDAALFNNVGVALLVQNRLDRAAQALYAAARRDPREPAVRLNLCLLERRMGRPQQALKHLRQAGNAAQDRRWRHLQAELETRDGRPDVAAAMLRELLDGASRDAVAHNTLGVAMAIGGEYAGAEECFGRALSGCYGLGAAHANLGLVEYRRGRLRAAHRRLRLAAQLSPEEACIQLNLGVICHQRRLYDSSKAAFRAALQLDPQMHEAHVDLAVALLDQERYDEALLAAEQALRLAPESGPALLAYGAALYHLMRYDEAITQFEAAAADPVTADLAYHNVGLAYAVSGRLDPALEAIQHAIELAPSRIAHQEALAYAYHINGDLTAAYQAYHSLVLTAHTAAVCYHLGLCDYVLDRHQTAIEWFEEALAADAGLYQSYYPLGCAYAALGDGEKALEFWARGLEHEPESAELLCNLGLAYYQRGQTEEALSLLRRAYFVKPDDPYFNNNLALAYCQAGRYDRAAEFFENCVDLMPDSVVARCNLGLAYYLSDLVDAAVEQWTIAAKVDPTYYQQRQAEDLKNTFDETHLRALEVDWRSRALPRLPLNSGFLTRYVTQLPDLPWHVIATQDLGISDEEMAHWCDPQFRLVRPIADD